MIDDGPERWKPVSGYEGRYEVSNLGKVRSLWYGRWNRSRRNPKILRPRKNNRGYLTVQLFEGGGIARQPLIHRLVLFTFRGPCPDGYEGSHLNGDSQNNRIWNLAWEPTKVNQRRRIQHGTQVHGERCWKAALGEDEVHVIIARLAKGESRLVLATEFDVSPTAIRFIDSGRTWKHIKRPAAEERPDGEVLIDHE